MSERRKKAVRRCSEIPDGEQMDKSSQTISTGEVDEKPYSPGETTNGSPRRQRAAGTRTLGMTSRPTHHVWTTARSQKNNRPKNDTSSTSDEAPLRVLTYAAVGD